MNENLGKKSLCVFSCEQNKLDTVENLEYRNQNNPIYFLSPFFLAFFFRGFKPMTSTPDDSFIIKLRHQSVFDLIDPIYS